MTAPGRMLAASMLDEQHVQHYVAGIRAAKPKMVARVGQAEADRWEENAILSAKHMVAAYNASRGWTGDAAGRTLRA